MRLLAATIGALLISVSQPALAQEHHDGMPHDGWQQGEQQQQQAELPPAGDPQLEMHPEMPEPMAKQTEMQPPAMPEPQPQQAEVQPPAMPEPQPQQAEVQPPAKSEPQPQQAEVQPPAMPEPQTEQGEVQPPAMSEPQPPQAEVRQPATPEPQTEQAAVQPPATPEPQTEQAAVQPPAMPEPQTEQAAVQPPAMPEPQPQQAAVQPLAMPEPQTEQAEMQPPAMPEPQTAQAETQPPAMPQPQMQADVQDVELPRDARWTAFLEPSLGTRMDLPSAVFSQANGAAYRGVGRQFKTADGRAALAIYSQRNNQRDTPASYLRKNFSFPRTTVSYERVTRDFFAVSGVREGLIYYSRCNVSATGATLHCFDLQFPARERTAWDAIVTRMSRSLRPLNRS